MPTLSAGEKAPFWARYSHGYYGQTRYGYFQQTPFILINGTDRTGDVPFDEGAIEWIQRDKDERDELSFPLNPGASLPTSRTPVQLAIGAVGRVRFTGRVSGCTRHNPQGRSGKSACLVQCEDNWVDFRGAQIVGRWEGDRWDEILVDVVGQVNTQLGTSFTTVNVKTTSPTADLYEVAGKDAKSVVEEIAKLASGGGTPWYIRLDWDDDLHFFDTETVIDGPREVTEDGSGNIDSGQRNVRPIEGAEVPIRTRVYARGAGSRVTSRVSAGATSIPLEDVERFKELVDEVGGTVKIICESPAQVIHFTGTSVSNGPGNLTGVPASGTGSVLYDIPADTPVRIYVQRDDATAQSSYGVIEHGIDAGDDGVKLCIARGDAYLAQNSTPPEGGEFDVYGDVWAQPGSELSVSAPNSLGQNTTFTVSEIRTKFAGLGEVLDRHVVYGNHLRRLTEFFKRVKTER